MLIGTLALLVVAAGALTTHLAMQPEPANIRPVVDPEGKYTAGSIPDSEGSAAVAAAVRALPTVLSYDYRSVDQGLKQAKSLMTKEFAGEFGKTFDATARPMATEQKAVTRTLVRGAGLVDVTDSGSARCLLYIDQVLVSSETMKDQESPAKVSQNRVVVDLRQDGKEWKVDAITPL
ncbi:hypothetical protein [Qaidamihabitans albus]|uniref:hypothetical protein n=1 Tax=Qaidamihabitans albus TaxID=2795733 RepID=UPI0018F24A20|nr:hypothetical protein [Qaidamihabitans albus]